MRSEERVQDERSILCVDVGNTETSFGFFRSSRLLASWTGTTPDCLTSDEAFSLVCDALTAMERKEHMSSGEFSVEDTVLSSVVPQHTAAWQTALRQVADKRPLTVGPGIKTGIRMRYKDPAEVGADRIADLAAVLADYNPPAIVVDLGTTTNFEVVDADGVFLGGVIAPGMVLGARSLAREAAKLPIVEVVAPRHVVGTTTREAIQAGVVLGEIARIDGLLDLIQEETGAVYSVIVTGSQAKAVSSLLSHESISDETLTLRGLARLYDLNRP